MIHARVITLTSPSHRGRFDTLIHEHERELALVFGDERGIGRQELENRHHGLPGLLADSLAVALDQLEAEGQCIGILAGGRQRLGELELQVRVVGFGGQGGASGLDAADLPRPEDAASTRP